METKPGAGREPEIINVDEDNKSMAEFFGSMPEWGRVDEQQILAHYKDMTVNKLSVRCGARVRFDLPTRNVILDIKVGEESLSVVCSLKQFVRKLTDVAMSEMWTDAGLRP